MRHALVFTAAALTCFTGASVRAQSTVSSTASYELGGVDQTLVRECGGNDAIKLTGSNNQVSLYGDCGSLEVVGSGNVVHVDAIQSATVEGTDNKVFWKKGSAPKFSQTGAGNSILQEDK